MPSLQCRQSDKFGENILWKRLNFVSIQIPKKEQKADNKEDLEKKLEELHYNKPETF